MIVNVYFSKSGQRGGRSAGRKRKEDGLLEQGRVLARDFIAHSPIWIPRCERRKGHFFLEDPIETRELVVLNNGQVHAE